MTDNYHHGDLRQALIKKGMEMLSREGIEKFSMRKLAVEVGVSHTAPYRHFKNKEEAIRTILLENSAAFTAALQSVEEESAPSDGREGLIRLGIRYVHFFVAHPEFLKFFTIISNQAAILEALFPQNETAPGAEELKVHETGECYESLSPDTSYGIFRGIAGGVFDQFPGLSEREIMLGYWAKVHGLASLLIGQPDYIPVEKRDEVIEKILRTPF